jgi:hypothetical protein
LLDFFADEVFEIAVEAFEIVVQDFVEIVAVVEAEIYIIYLNILRFLKF